MRERYLIEADLRKVPGLTADVLVIGAGVAGLRSAIAAAEQGASVTVLLKRGEGDSNTAHAQGGVAAALGDGDMPELHLTDTIDAGAGLADESVARKVVAEGPARVGELIEWGAEFDLAPDGGLAFTREGGHSRDRILHANGDATGREIARVLQLRAAAEPNVTVLPGHFATDLLHAEESVYGALAACPREGTLPGGLVRIEARATILATGGAGRLYRETTNPEVATGDGIALAFRAGARLADLEFVQFHPTTLYVAGAPRLLVSEAVRGEGAYLLNTKRERFMPELHPQAELAPRDVVSASIVEEMARTESPHVYLDLRHLDAALVMGRFPQIAATCAGYGIDITSDLIPVRPASHYMMGGVVTDLEGRTSVEGLYAAGEVACTGLHGANRLASNSILEGLVFGKATGESAAASPARGPFREKRLSRVLSKKEIELDLDDLARSLRALMNRSVGVFRNRSELESALRALGHWQEYLMPMRPGLPTGLELQNMLTAAILVVRAALMREESRGAHRRLDFPERDDAEWQRRIVQSMKDFE
jgi:L-aspartate oxidase